MSKAKAAFEDPSFSPWWTSPAGRAFLVEEQTVIQPLVAPYLGERALLVGDASRFIPLLAKSPIPHLICLSSLPDLSSTAASISVLKARPDKVPLAGESIDLVYLAHCLMRRGNPYEVLSEAFRILKPEGHLLVCNFSPWSLLGIGGYLMPAQYRQAPFYWNQISILQLQHWIALVGFEILKVEKIGKTYSALLRGGYAVWLKKPVLTLTPIRPVRAILAKPGVEVIEATP